MARYTVTKQKKVRTKLDELQPSAMLTIGKRMANSLKCDPRHLFGLRANNSVLKAGIKEGDMLIFRRSAKPKDGDTVAVQDTVMTFAVGIYHDKGDHIAIAPLDGSRRMPIFMDDKRDVVGVLAKVLTP